MFDLTALEPGCTYAFQTRQRCQPVTAGMPRSVQARRFLGYRVIDGLQGIEVERASGKVHWIAVDAIEGAALVQFPD